MHYTSIDLVCVCVCACVRGCVCAWARVRVCIYIHTRGLPVRNPMRGTNFLNYVILLAALGPWVYSASTRYEYRECEDDHTHAHTHIYVYEYIAETGGCLFIIPRYGQEQKQSSLFIKFYRTNFPKILKRSTRNLRIDCLWSEKETRD
jgi:hypothetical protein